MSAIRCTCIEKFRKPNGQLFGYRLQATDGSRLDIEHDELKRKIKGNKIVVDNLQISIDGKLIDRVPTASTVDDLVAYITEAANSNLGIIQINNINRSNSSITVYQEYEASGGSDDVWTSYKGKYITNMSIQGNKIKSSTKSELTQDGSDIPYEYIKKDVERCRDIDATKENIIKYGLVWNKPNAFNYATMPKQAMLMEKVIEHNTVKKQKVQQTQQVLSNTYNSAPDTEIIGYNNGRKILDGVGDCSGGGVMAWNSIEYWRSLDSEEREKEYNDPNSPWYHYDGHQESSMDPHGDWY